ncbi:MAG: 2-C-methyl-D-erythritol 4-phosphate cytidylyltransferase [Burkholderiales bacterium]|nr:2-C-methyl-D-erythritol 4-phosphate cytidylyltransferase [Burkholderiales bacterium]
MANKIHVLIPCAGHGSRFASDLPKQYHNLCDKTVLDWTLSAFQSVAIIDSITVVYSQNDSFIQNYIQKYPKINFLPLGGDTRANSVINGLINLDTAFDDWVLVHDAARCCINPLDIQKLIRLLINEKIGGILASRATDTIKYVPNNHIEKTIDRNHIFLAQTPQMFRAGILLEALKSNDLSAITDEASAVELSGLPVQIIEADYPNFKVTYPIDLEYAKFIINQEKYY